MISPDTIWKVITDKDARSIELFGLDGAQTSSPETRAILTFIFNLATERRPLNLSDHHNYWLLSSEERSIGPNIIQAAIETVLRKPLDASDRDFLKHLWICSCYFGMQSDQEDHWHYAVESINSSLINAATYNYSGADDTIEALRCIADKAAIDEALSKATSRGHTTLAALLSVMGHDLSPRRSQANFRLISQIPWA